uniref:Uncharacterized 8.0 kDa protein in 100 kDa protein region n=1 Tax=Human adenovirus F serotype 41 TaxID=10524 RepID=YL12_ADE41|nr:RecName: Full=Uncharacterized 8.0 kDa protein in 100 kDa protein region [Human adenovirus 41]CAA36762.1 unnamed protein product [Human adenovirus 41]
MTESIMEGFLNLAQRLGIGKEALQALELNGNQNDRHHHFAPFLQSGGVMAVKPACKIVVRNHGLAILGVLFGLI